MTELQQNRYDQLIRKVGDLKGPGSKVSEVLTELFPVFDVENLPGELIRLSGARICFGGGAITSAAGENATGVLINPAGSGKLVTLSTCHIAATGTGVFRWGVTSTVRGTLIGTQTFRDNRDVPPSLPSGQVAQISAVALAVGTNQTRNIAHTDLFLFDPDSLAVLSPGTSFEIGFDGLNQTIQYTFSWKERTAEPSEVGP